MLDRTARWALLLGTLAAVPTLAQSAPATPPAAPAPAAPAAPAAKPKPCQAPEHRQFDFWVGNWEVKNPKGEIEGTNRIDVIQDGCVIQEHWDDGNGMTGTSFNIYDQGAHKWHQTWVDNVGSLLVLNGSFTGGKMILSGESVSQKTGKTILNRISWTPIDANHVRQFWEVSRDGGKTWASNFDGTYTRK